MPETISKQEAFLAYEWIVTHLDPYKERVYLLNDPIPQIDPIPNLIKQWHPAWRKHAAKTLKKKLEKDAVCEDGIPEWLLNKWMSTLVEMGTPLYRNNTREISCVEDM